MRADLDVVCFDELSYLSKRITDFLFFTYLADRINCVVTDQIIVMNHMRYDYLELKPIVYLLLLNKQLFIELTRQCISKEILLQVFFVILGFCSNNRGELYVESLVR